jgi:hypothetical protein
VRKALGKLFDLQLLKIELTASRSEIRAIISI